MEPDFRCRKIECKQSLKIILIEDSDENKLELLIGFNCLIEYIIFGAEKLYYLLYFIIILSCDRSI